MPRFRKKPVVIEARQFTDNAVELIAWSGGDLALTNYPTVLSVESMEGDVKAHVGDWIIRGVAGEFYPCKPDIFEATYDAVNWSATDQIPISMAESEQLLVERLAEFQERGE